MIIKKIKNININRGSKDSFKCLSKEKAFKLEIIRI